MRKETVWRLVIVAAVAIFSILYVTPTLRYFNLVAKQRHASAEEAAKMQPQIDELRTRSVPLGLDLQGGVDVLLAVDVDKARMNKVEKYAEDLRTKFRQESPALDATVEVSSGTQSQVQNDSGLRVVVNAAREDQKRSVDNIIADMQKRGIFTGYDGTKLQASQPLPLIPDPHELQRDSGDTVNAALNVLRNRVDQLGVTQPVVVKQGTDRIRVQIPGEKDPQKVVDTIIKPAVLEFKEVYASKEADFEGHFRDNSAEIIDTDTGKVKAGKTIPAGFHAVPYKDRRAPAADAAPNTKAPLGYILLRKKPDMTGQGIRDAGVSTRPGSLGLMETAVTLEFNKPGTEDWARVTKKHLNHQLAIVLDGVCYSAPNIESVMTEGNAQISNKGNGFSADEARELSLVLKAGALPAELKTLDKREVEATLGVDSIRASINALLVGSVLVAIAMTTYYGTAGFISVVAVFLNVLIVFAFMRMASATLTLSGIGGILLTVGMAVDANVLIYERIREELHSGRTLKQAVAVGFGRAFSVIFDTNLTTLISGLTLLQFGEGSVKGFALSLNIGILASMFTGLFVTRTLVDAWLGWQGKLGLGKLQVFRDGIYFDFIKLRKFSFMFSGALFLICALYLLPFKPFPGPNWGVDFSGGLLAEVTTKQDIDTTKVGHGYGDMRVQKIAGQVSDESRFMVRIKQEGRDLAQVRKELTSRLDKNVGAGQYNILGTEQVSDEVGGEFTTKAMLACLVASGLILCYIAFRFEFSFGLSAVIALFHDLIITFGLYNILANFHLAGEVTLDVVAALLVVLGFSVHDTIIILARVRENRHLHPGMDMKELINRSISESLNRTVMTVGTVVIVLLVMLLIGGAGLYDFALVLLIGILKGTYSSSFVASPILYELYLRAKRKGKDITGKRAPAKLGSGTAETGRHRTVPAASGGKARLK